LLDYDNLSAGRLDDDSPPLLLLLLLGRMDEGTRRTKQRHAASYQQRRRLRLLGRREGVMAEASVGRWTNCQQ